MFEEYQRLLSRYLLVRNLQDECIRAAHSWANLCQNNPNDLDIPVCFQESLARMKKACENSKNARDNLDNFVRENLKA